MAKLTMSKGPGAQLSIGSGATSLKTYGNPIPYVAPWAVALGLLLLAAGVRLGLARDEYSWWWSLFTAVVYATLTGLAWRASRARGMLTCGLATGGVGLAGAWSWWVAGVPNFTWRHLVIYLGGMIVVCGGSNMLTAFREGGQPGPTMHDRLRKALDDVRNINAPRVVDGTVLAELEAEPGANVADLQKELPAALESLHDLPEGSVRVTKGGPGASTRHGQLRINPVDLLASPPPYPGPSIRDGSGPFGFGTIMDPLGCGRRQGGQPLQFWLPGDPAANRNASLIQVTGMSGAGKTVFIRNVLVEGMSRGGPDVFEYWYLNARKADQEPPWVRRGAARFADDKKGVIAALRDLRDEMPERARQLGERGCDQWAPGCGLPFRLVVADEFAAVAPDVERLLTDLAETLRSLGVVLLCGFQRATGDRFPTSARSNFGTHVCFGVRDDVDASMALPDEVLEAGAAPWLWGNKRPGMCYLTAPGVPEDLWTEEARTCKPDPHLQLKWAEHFIALREGRPGGAPPGAASGEIVPAGEEGEIVDEDEVAGEAGVPARDEQMVDDVVDLDRVDDDLVAEETADLVEDTLGDDDGADYDEEIDRPKVPADVADVNALDHRAPIPVDGGGMRLALSPKMTPEAAQRHLRDYLDGLRQQGVRQVKVEDFGAEVLTATGMKASWLHKWCNRYAEGPDRLMDKLDERGCYELRPLPALAQG